MYSACLVWGTILPVTCCCGHCIAKKPHTLFGASQCQVPCKSYLELLKLPYLTGFEIGCTLFLRFRSEIGFGDLYILVWNRVRVFRTAALSHPRMLWDPLPPLPPSPLPPLLPPSPFPPSPSQPQHRFPGHSTSLLTPPFSSVSGNDSYIKATKSPTLPCLTTKIFFFRRMSHCRHGRKADFSYMELSMRTKVLRPLQMPWSSGEMRPRLNQRKKSRNPRVCVAT